MRTTLNISQILFCRISKNVRSRFLFLKKFDILHGYCGKNEQKFPDFKEIVLKSPYVDNRSQQVARI
jgi:hypothetical protein